MKELIEKNKIVLAICILIIIAGIVVMFTLGFNKGVDYANAKRIDIYIGKDFKISEIKNIVNEVINNSNIIQISDNAGNTIGNYVSITVKDCTDEQVEALKTKVYEKYNVIEKLQNVETFEVPETSIKDVIKPYILPLSISTLVIMIFLCAKYRKIGILKVALVTLLGTIGVELLFFSVIAIVRIPFGIYIMPISLFVYFVYQLVNISVVSKK